MQAKRLTTDAKTGVSIIEDFEFTPTPYEPPAKGIDPEKLKQILLDKGIITKFEDVE